MNVLVITRDLGEFTSVNIYTESNTPIGYKKGNFSNESLSRSFEDSETGEWVHADCYWSEDVRILEKKKKSILNNKIRSLNKRINNLKRFT